MSLNHSPSVVTNGLILYTDMSNTQKSWKGAPTVNLYTDPSFATGSPHPVNGGGAVVADPRNSNNKVLKFSPSGGNQYNGRDIPVTLSSLYSYQMEMFVSSDFNGTDFRMYPEQAGGGAGASYDLTKKGTWQTLKYSGRVASTTNFRMLCYVLSAFTTGYAMFTNVQVEQNAFVTPFVNGTRSNTQAIVDLTGNNTLTATSLTYASDNTFSFNGVGDYITVPSTALALTSWTQPWTLGVWMYVPASATWSDGANQSHFVSKGQTNGSWGIIRGTNNNSIHAAIRTDAAVYQTGGSITRDAWYNVVGTWDGVSTVSTYINGVLADFATATTLTGVPDTGNLLIGGSTTAWTGSPGIYYTGKLPNVTGYNRALSAAEVSQNFNALRGRYGI